MKPTVQARLLVALLSLCALQSPGLALAQPTSSTDPAALQPAPLQPALPQSALPQPGLLQLAGAWRIAQARSEPLLDTRRARLDFHSDGRLTGHTSCNPLQAHYTLDGERLALHKLSTGRERCATLQLEQEDRVLSALDAVATARVRPDGLLELRDADGRGVLRATRWAAAAP